MGLILKLIQTFIRETTVGRAGVQVDATVCVHRDHRGAEEAIYRAHAAAVAVAFAIAVAVAAPATVVIVDHHHLCRHGGWKTKAFL